MNFSEKIQRVADGTNKILGSSANLHGSVMSLSDAVQKGDAASIMSTTSSIVSTVNSIAALAGTNNKSSDALALAAAGSSLSINISKLSDQIKNNENIKLTDVQNVIGDTFQILGDTASLVGGRPGQILGLELNLLGLGIKAYGEVKFSNQTMPAKELFSEDNWKGFAWDLAEGWSRWVYDWVPDDWNPWKEINRDGKFYYTDPLTLDLDGDGIETVGTNAYKGALFDHDKDGIQTATGWVAADDGFLVIDRNEDGIINNGNELFGDNYTLKDGSTAPTGFAALAEFDSNGDGVVDAKDENFAKLRVWRDLNQDGISQEGELFTLESLNIQSLNTSYQDTNTRLGNGNSLVQKGSYTLSDGQTREMGLVA